MNKRTGQTEGLRVGFKEWVDGWDGWMGGQRNGWFAKVDNRSGLILSVQGGSIGLALS